MTVCSLKTLQQRQPSTSGRLISVLVADIRDFTVLTRQTDEKVLSEAIGTWFKRAGEIISEHGSWVDKYIGDAVMARLGSRGRGGYP